MFGKKITQTLAFFPKNELRELRKFLQSPFFNQRDDVLPLFDCLVENPDKPDRNAIFEKIFPGKKYDDAQLRLSATYLLKLVENFVAQKEWQNAPGQQALWLARGCQRRGMTVHFSEAIAAAESALEKMPRRNSEWLDLQAKVQWEQHRFESGRQPSEIRFLRAATEAADAAYIAEKQRHICHLEAHRVVFKNTREAQSAPPEMPVFTDAGALTSTPAAAVWFYCRKMLAAPEDESFYQQFKALLFEHGAIFEAAEILELYLLAVNFCVRQVNAGRRAFFQEMMDLYKEGLRRGYLLENGKISRFTYHNVVAVGLQLADFEWVEQFIEQYRPALERPWRDSSHSFNRARLDFTRGNYDAALQRLQHSNYTDPLLNLAAKTFALKIYYETGAHDLLLSHLDAMQNYIRRKPSLGYHRTNYLNIVQYARKMLTVNAFDKKEVENLRQKIREEAVLTEREWMLERLG